MRCPKDRGVDLHAPKNRYEWWSIVRRCRLGSSAKAVAITLSTYADPDGTRIFPGRQRLAAVMEKSPSTVDRALKQLRVIGLIERVSEGRSAGRRALADAYRLTIPEDILEVVPMLDPDETRKQSAWVPSHPEEPVSTRDDSSEGSVVTGASDQSSPEMDQSSPETGSVVTDDDPPIHDHSTYLENYPRAREVQRCTTDGCSRELFSSESKSVGLCGLHRLHPVRGVSSAVTGVTHARHEQAETEAVA